MKRKTVDRAFTLIELLVVVGLAPGVLFVTGVLMWWRKRKRRWVRKGAAERARGRREEAVGV